MGCSITIKRGDNRGLTVDKARNHREGLVKPPAAHFTSQNDKLCILIPPNELRGSCLLVRHDSPETCVINVGSVGVGVGCSITILRAVFSLHLPLASRPAWRHVELGETHESLFDGAIDHTHCAVAAQKSAVATFLFGSDDSAGKPSCPLWQVSCVVGERDLWCRANGEQSVVEDGGQSAPIPGAHPVR